MRKYWFFKVNKRRNIKTNKKTTFNLIVTGRQFDKIMEFLKEEKGFDNCIKNICIYCSYPEKHSSLKDKDKRIYEIYDTKEQVEKFIEHFSSEEIKPFPTTKLVKFSEYNEYKDRHFAISQYYGDFSEEEFYEFYEKIKLIIKEEEEKKELRAIDPKKLEDAFLKFNKKKNDLKGFEEIIRVYTTNSLYKDLNKWLMNTKIGFFDTVAFFTSRLMYSLNQYGFKEERDKKNKNIIIKKTHFYNENNKVLHRGAKLVYSKIL